MIDGITNGSRKKPGSHSIMLLPIGLWVDLEFRNTLTCEKLLKVDLLEIVQNLNKSTYEKTAQSCVKPNV